jgi:hypothetical protein
MNFIINRVAIVVLSLLAISTVGAVGIVREFSGTSSVTTENFDVTGPWIIDWRANGEFPAMLGFEINLIDADNGKHVGRIVKLSERAGNGVRLFRKGGRFRMRIDSTLARWNVKIEEISEKDLQLYTPKNGG